MGNRTVEKVTEEDHSKVPQHILEFQSITNWVDFNHWCTKYGSFERAHSLTNMLESPIGFWLMETMKKRYTLTGEDASWEHIERIEPKCQHIKVTIATNVGWSDVLISLDYNPKVWDKISSKNLDSDLDSYEVKLIFEYGRLEFDGDFHVRCEHPPYEYVLTFESKHELEMFFREPKSPQFPNQ